MENFLDKYKLHLTGSIISKETCLLDIFSKQLRKVLKLRPANLKLRMANILSQGKSNNFITHFAVKLASRFGEQFEKNLLKLVT